MKIRILDHSVRLRLSQTEVQSLSQGEVILCTTTFSPNQHFRYSLQKHTTGPDATYLDGHIQIILPEKMVAPWANSQTAVSMEFEQQHGTEEPLRVLIEKDFKCLQERPHEDESDLFPHPKGDSTVC